VGSHPSRSADGSIEFSKFLLKEGKVAVSPGIGFGDYGDDYVRFALIENEHRTRQAVRGIREGLRRRALGAPSARSRRLTAALDSPSDEWLRA